jgi:hypothetical protein
LRAGARGTVLIKADDGGIDGRGIDNEEVGLWIQAL